MLRPAATLCMFIGTCFASSTLSAQDRPAQFRLAYVIKLHGEEMLTGVAVCHAGIDCELTSAQLAKWGLRLTYNAGSPDPDKSDRLRISCDDRDCAFSNYRSTIDVDRQSRLDILEGTGSGLRLERRPQLGEIYLMRTRLPGEDTADERERSAL